MQAPEVLQLINCNGFTLEERTQSWLARSDFNPDRGLFIGKNKGHLALKGPLRYSDLEAVFLYQGITNYLEENGITLPGPNPNFQELDRLLETVSSVKPVNLNQSKPKVGENLAVFGYDNKYHRSTDVVVYIGTVADLNSTNAYNKLGPSVLPIQFSEVYYRVEYTHFSPHSVYPVRILINERYPIITRSRNWEWNKQVYTPDQQVFTAIQNEAGRLLNK